jgi:hypothetical protein
VYSSGLAWHDRIGELLAPDLVAVLNIYPSYWVVALQYRGSEKQRQENSG